MYWHKNILAMPVNTEHCYLGRLLRLRCWVGGCGDGVGDHRVGYPEVLQPVLQAVALQRHEAAGVRPGLGEVEVQADLHPREVEAGDGDKRDVHLNLHLPFLSLPVLWWHVQTLYPEVEGFISYSRQQNVSNQTC